jgi:hypothetical protein
VRAPLSRACACRCRQTSATLTIARTPRRARRSHAERHTINQGRMHSSHTRTCASRPSLYAACYLDVQIHPRSFRPLVGVSRSSRALLPSPRPRSCHSASTTLEMAAYINLRRKIMLFILFLLVLFAFAAASRYEPTDELHRRAPVQQRCHHADARARIAVAMRMRPANSTHE